MDRQKKREDLHFVKQCGTVNGVRGKSGVIFMPNEYGRVLDVRCASAFDSTAHGSIVEHVTVLVPEGDLGGKRDTYLGRL